MSMKLNFKWMAIGCGAFFGLIAVCIAGAVLFLFDTENRPVCHKAIYFMLVNWQEQQQKTRLFPNVEGEQAASLALLTIETQLSGWSSLYSYVPSLGSDAPQDLVLFYINQPTRWTWHGHYPTVFEDKKWILVPVGMEFCNTRNDRPITGEFSERVSFNEFRDRLRKTLDYLRTKQPLHWERIVKEHEAFLAEAERRWNST